MSDDGLQIYYASKSGVKFLDSIPWETEQFVAAVSRIIIKKAKRQPIIIFNDMVEQHYRKERVPNVSFFDKANVIERRLSVAFPSQKVRAALKLKNKTFEDKKSGGSPYLFAAIPNSAAYKLTIKSIQAASAPVTGLYLLPLEASAVARALSLKLSKEDKQQTTWTVFAGQHHSGGLRQVVTRNGELALTRMTPIVDTDVEPELWAKEVSGELTATMSYLARFGYKEADGLRIIVIANDVAAQYLEPVAKSSEFDVMPASKAADYLGVKIGRQEEERYATPIHVALLSKIDKFQLPMNSKAISRLSMPRKVASFILLGGLIASAYYGFLSFQSFKQGTALSDQLKVALEQKRTVNEEYRREVEIKKKLGIDFGLVNNSLKIFEEMQRQKMKPLPVMREIGLALGSDIHLDNLRVALEGWDKEKKEEQYDPITGEVIKEQYSMAIVLSLSFPGTIDPDLGVRRINILKKKLDQRLSKDYNIEITRQVADLSYTGNFTSDGEEEDDEDYFAEIVIRGLVK